MDQTNRPENAIEVKIRRNGERTARPFVSVIIPVYNDPKRLERCVQALARQSYPKDRYEVIVVDNASSPPVNLDAPQGMDLKVLVEHRRGSYAARNLGLRAARGEVFAFTDSDCIPDPQWIDNGVRVLLNDPGCGLVGGRFQLFYPRPMRTLAERFDHCVAFPQDRYVHVDGYAATGNAFVHRHVVEHVGGFDPVLQSGGDTEFGNRVRDHGYRIRYAPHAAVSHPVRDRKESQEKTVRFARALRARHMRSHTPFIRRILDIGLYLVPSPYQARQVIRSKHLRGPWRTCVGLALMVQRRLRLVASYLVHSVRDRHVNVPAGPGPMSPVLMTRRPATPTPLAPRRQTPTTIGPVTVQRIPAQGPTPGPRAPPERIPVRTTR